MGVYLDYSASTPMHKKVLNTLIEVSGDIYANPSSLHRMGFDANDLVENSRGIIAGYLGVNSDNIIFTSGATESNNLAITGIVNNIEKSKNTLHIIVPTTEHSSVLNVYKKMELQGVKVSYLPVDEYGIIDMEMLKTEITKDTVLLSVMHVNNETGVIQPVSEIAKLISEYPSVCFHVDGAQAVGKTKISFEGIDLYTISAHKIGGPKGIGLLIKKSDIDLAPLMFGGDQEFGNRPGTLNVPLIAAFTEAIKETIDNFEAENKKVTAFNQYLYSRISKMQGLFINSPPIPLSVPHIINFSFPELTSPVILNFFDKHGITISSQSACSSTSSKSRVLSSMGKNDRVASSSVRVSFGTNTQESDILQFIECLELLIGNLSVIHFENRIL